MNARLIFTPGLGRALVLAALFCATPGMSSARADAVDFTGHYELADAKADRSFSLDVTQKGSSVELSFSAAMADGSGAAPDGEGKGEADPAGRVKFTFKDSFDNAGTGTLAAGKDGYHLKLDAATVNDARALRFYGEVLLKKTAEKAGDP